MEDQETGWGEPQRQWAKIVARAWADADFKARLLADPGVVLQEAGIELPPGLKLRVVENTAKVTHLVLPAEPSGVRQVELEERQSAAGVLADCFGCCSGGCALCDVLPCEGLPCSGGD